LKNHKKCPVICFAPDKKKKSPALSKSEVHWYFMFKRERREVKGERVRARERARKRESAGNYISRLPGP
jgi:hypothetical protein